jgi:uncharacterized membrane protein
VCGAFGQFCGSISDDCRVLSKNARQDLSAAVNDPTTANQVLDYIGEVLAHIGRTDLDRRSRPDESGTPVAVVMATRRWEDLVTLSLRPEALT